MTRPGMKVFLLLILLLNVVSVFSSNKKNCKKKRDAQVLSINSGKFEAYVDKWLIYVRSSQIGDQYYFVCDAVAFR